MEVRPLKELDVPYLVSILNKEKVNEFLYFAPAENSVYEEFFLKAINQEDHYVLVATIDDLAIGYCGITPCDVKGVYELGYIIDCQYWGEGIATKLGEVGVRFIKDILNGHRIEANCFEGNLASQCVLKKLGFHFEGISHHYYCINDDYYSKLNYGKCL